MPWSPRYNPHLKSFRDKLVAEGKSKLAGAKSLN
jgi:hypothetical protein